MRCASRNSAIRSAASASESVRRQLGPAAPEKRSSSPSRHIKETPHTPLEATMPPTRAGLTRPGQLLPRPSASGRVQSGRAVGGQDSESSGYQLSARHPPAHGDCGPLNGGSLGVPHARRLGTSRPHTNSGTVTQLGMLQPHGTRSEHDVLINQMKQRTSKPFQNDVTVG